METVGEYLKRIREEQGLSIEQMTGKTRISPTFIRALEENRLDQFPGEVFARGFVRVYGSCLGLDDEETMTRFNQSAQSFFRERDESKRSTEQSAETEKSRRAFQGRMIQVVLVAALGLAIVTVYYINSRHLKSTEETSGLIPGTVSEPEAEPPLSEEISPTLNEPAVNKPALKEAELPKPDKVQAPPPGPVGGPPKPPGVKKPAMAEKPPVPPMPPVAEKSVMSEKPTAPPKTPAPPPAKSEEELPLIVNVPGTLSPPSVPGRGLVLVITAVEASWVSARIDGGIIKEVFLRPGQKVTWKASDHFLVSFGNAGGVKIEFNGKTIPPFGPKGTVVKDVQISRQ